MTVQPKFSLLLMLVVAGVLVSGARAADPLSDRRAVRPAQVTPVAKTTTGNEAVLELLNDIEELKSQLRTLRGQMETQGYQLEQLKNAQRQSAIDTDRRLRELEGRAGGATAAPATGAPSTAAPSLRPGSVSPPAAAAVPPAAPRGIPSASEQQQYDAAFALMKKGLYQQAAARFRDFVAKNPNSALADNAQYWVGEAAYVTRDFRTALDEFSKVVTIYPQSPKVPDALLKIGYTHYELAAYDRARETLSQVIARYPNTVVAKSAQLRLERISKEGK